MIGFAANEDKCKIIRLWNICFGDSEKYIKAFLDRLFTNQNCLVFREGDEILSMLFLLQGHVFSSGKKLSAYYIYAACTLPEQRNKGIMSRLMAQAIEYAALSQTDCLCLVPATESLFSYYAKFGFENTFKRKNISLSRDILIIISDKRTVDCSPRTNEIKSVRDKSLSSNDCFIWDENMIDYSVRENISAGGFAVFARIDETFVGYALFVEQDNKVIVKELCALNGYFGAVINVLIQAAAGDTFCFSLPVDFPISSDILTVKYNGMALPVSNAAKQALRSISNAYIGLTLE